MATLFSDFLSVLGVKHTEDYSDARFAAMPFQSMFGLANLLREYGVATMGVKVPQDGKADAIGRLPLPCLVDTADGFMIVQRVADGKVTYMSQHKPFTATVEEVAEAWTGVALLAQASPKSEEPEYGRHRIGELAQTAKYWVLCILAAALLGFAMWWSRLYAHWTAWLLAAFDCGGIWLSWMLVQKSLGIQNAKADAVCSMLEEGGCDEIAKSEASSFMGIFKWSEVGLTYFSVSLLAMLLFPQTLPALAAINILCLPYTVWSISYQGFIAKTWCTLCVSVQATLWLLFGCYLVGGSTGKIFPLTGDFCIDFGVLACIYVVVLLAINRLDSAIAKLIKTQKDGSQQQ